MGKPRAIGPRTVEILGSHWPASSPWEGLYFDRAVLRHRSIWGDDYHLKVPWLHPDDIDCADDPDSWAIYRVRPKRDCDRFVQIAGVWVVERGDRGVSDGVMDDRPLIIKFIRD